MNNTSIEYKLNQANQYFTNEQFAESAQLYKEILKDNPQLAKLGISIRLAHCLLLSVNWPEISVNLIPGTNYLKISGWLNSLSQGKAVNAENQPIPWYTYPAIEFIEDKIKHDSIVFEFGGGQSTLWWSQRVKQVISIESDEGWFNQINQQMPPNVNLNLQSDEKKYADCILAYPDKYFDVIIVDGINRNGCLENSLAKLKENGLLIFDNTDDHRYDSSIRLLFSHGYKKIDFWGLIPGYFYKNCTSLFFKSTEILEMNSFPSDKKSLLGKSCMQITSPKATETSNYEYEDNWQLTTPVAFLIFNRPDTTARVFEAIRQAKPPKLLVVADGARADKLGEAEKCAATRAIINQVDWECEVLTNYSDVNLGCRKRVSSGLDWIFEQVEEAIILEDDCLPHPTFFRYCQELLEKYRDDERIMMISGNNFQFGRNRTEDSYYFSRYGHCWGWASWRRAWTKYDDSMQLWTKLRDNGWLNDILQSQQEVTFWTRVFQRVYDGFNSWGAIWLFTLWANNGLTILPNVNLVSNIGFGSGTHTAISNSSFANIPVEVMNFPLNNPAIINRNIEADNFTEQTQFSGAISSSSKLKITPENSETHICKICNSDSHYFATAKVLQKYDVNYFQCSNCGFVQTEDPYWLNEAYSEAIATSDVGLVYRNNMMANITSKLLFNYFDHQAKFLDYGGGYGLFVRLMRDQGFDFYWLDKFCKNILAQGFELQENDRNLEIITAFELFEHLTNPVQDFKEIFDLCPNILFSTDLLPEDNPTPDKWWYYTPHEGQHISIYTRKSLEILASKYNLKLYTNGKSLHLLTTKENLPQNLFEKLANNELQSPNKPSLLSRDFNQVVTKILSITQGVNGNKILNSRQPKQPIIFIDGVFFQLYNTGIARVWRSLLEQWSNTDFAQHILVLDRANTAPKIPGIRYRTIHPYDYNNSEADKQILQQICEEEQAKLFISTYYTTPIDTPSVFMAYDMIPEVLGGNLNEPMWREKHHAIQHASAYISISEHTAKDLSKLFSDIPLESINIAHCGVEHHFYPASDNEINTFKHKYGISKPYFLLGGLRGYKNSILFFQAFSQLANKQGFDIVATGAGSQLPPEWRQYTAGCTFHSLQLTDEELRLAYSGAVALVYPSKYEGFGMPIIEAMACGCPVITCPNASIPEVGGEAAIYVHDDDVMGLADALCEVQKPSLRNVLINAGLAQAKKFSWTNMAEIVSTALVDATLLYLNLRDINYIIFPDWTQPEDELGLELQQVIQTLATHPEREKITLIINAGNIATEDAEMFLSSVAMNLLMEDLNISETIDISLVAELGDMQWQSLLPRIYGRIILNNEDKTALASAPASNLNNLTIDNLIPSS
ncbi:glycosyltransferase [Nodularia spumigena CS-591/12]|uniref:methyltransferase domain-containing protein n=1 Tax=Nodularia spumigena TaxID=70799 RepID=UPI00233150FA|nr:methyltransferase domain-containing protein [Nodularia spumigena]MDB9306649.1 glycosyltransferase [Nodularia spumigena CS-591/12]